MIYRPLGRTNLEVSIISFGAAPLGNEYGDTEVQVGVRAVHAAIDHGINFFDTSPYYGRTLSESRLGEALRGRRDRVILATKCGRYDYDQFDFSAARIRQSVEESLTRLQTDVIDLFQLHDIEFEHKGVILEESLPALEKLKEAGKIRFTGITGYPIHLLHEVAAAWPVDTILSYCHYNLLNTTLEDEVVPFAKAQGIGLINASSLHMGVLTDQGAQPWHPAPQFVHERAKQAGETLKQKGANITEVALQFVLQNPDVHTTLVGMRAEEEVHQNIRHVGKAPDPELLAELEAMFAPIKDINWQSGLPENHEPNAEQQRERQSF